MKVITVSDKLTTVKQVNDLLTRAGIGVICVTQNQGIDVLKQQVNPDVIIVDSQMAQAMEICHSARKDKHCFIALFVEEHSADWSKLGVNRG